jgi:hypothetical protein
MRNKMPIVAQQRCSKEKIKRARAGASSNRVRGFTAAGHRRLAIAGASLTHH